MPGSPEQLLADANARSEEAGTARVRTGLGHSPRELEEELSSGVTDFTRRITVVSRAMVATEQAAGIAQAARRSWLRRLIRYGSTPRRECFAPTADRRPASWSRRSGRGKSARPAAPALHDYLIDALITHGRSDPVPLLA